MRRALLVLVVLVVLVAGAGFFLIRHGFSAREEPSAIERVIATTARNLAIPRAARELTNPVAVTPAALAGARAHFADHCATCHAEDGSGETIIGRNMYPKAPDMRLPATQQRTDGALYYTIYNGVRLTGMPAWGGEDDDEEIWALVHFIRRLPTLTPQQLDEMKRVTPDGTAPMDMKNMDMHKENVPHGH